MRSALARISPRRSGVLTFASMKTMHGLLLMVMLAAMGLAGHPAWGASPVEKSGKTYTKRVCPKSPGAQVMRCHALVVTDSKGNPIETPSPPSPLPNGKRPDR